MEENLPLKLFFGLYCNTCEGRPSNRFSRHNEIEMLFFQTDEPVVIRYGGRTFQIQPDATVLFWGAIPHQLVHIADNSRLCWVTIPPAILIRWGLPNKLEELLLNGKMLIENDPRMRELDLLQLPVWKSESKSQTPDNRRNLLFSIETRLRRFKNFTLPPESKSGSQYSLDIHSGRQTFDIMYTYITRNFSSRITAVDIAAAADIHPNYAATLFHHTCGIGITEFIQMLRVYEAQRILLTTNYCITSVAEKAGFGSKTMFYDCFSRICGISPKRYRQDPEMASMSDLPKNRRNGLELRKVMYDSP